jgi:hypothetical protein
MKPRYAFVKWLAFAFACTLFIVFLMFYIAVKRVNSYTFMNYTASVYLPAQRRLNGKWPTNLHGLSAYVKAEEKRKGKSYMLDDVLRDYHQLFQSMEIVKADRNTMNFRLHLKYWSADCKSTVHPDSGRCK